MRVLGLQAPIAVADNLALVLRAALCVLDILNVVADRDHELACDEVFAKQVHRQRVGHLTQDYPRLVCGVRLVKHLARAKAVTAGLVRLDSFDGAGLVAPGMVNEQFGVLAKELEKEVLVRQRAPSHVAHREHPVLLELFGVTSAHAPEVRQRRVTPELFAVASLVQLRDTHTVFVSGDVLRLDVHGDFAEIQIRANTSRCRDTCRCEHVEDNLHCQTVRRKAVGWQVFGNVHEHLVDGVDDDVLGRNVLHVDLVNARAVLHVVSHARRGYEEVHGE